MTQELHNGTQELLRVPHGVCPRCDLDCGYRVRCPGCRRWVVQRWWLVPLLIVFYSLTNFGIPVVVLWLPFSEVEPVWSGLDFSVEIWEGWSRPLSWLSLLVLIFLSAWIADLKHHPVRSWAISTLCLGPVSVGVKIWVPAWRNWQRALMVQAYRGLSSEVGCLMGLVENLGDMFVHLLTHVKALADQKPCIQTETRLLLLLFRRHCPRRSDTLAS